MRASSSNILEGACFLNRQYMKLQYSKFLFTPKEINVEEKTLRAVFSTDDVDRHGEVVDQGTWLLKDFMTNPVVLFGHDHGQPPVGKIVELDYNDDGNLEGTVKFAADEYPFASVIWNLYREGYMKAFSVGFSPGEVEYDAEGVAKLKENTLFEISTVSVPANAMALAKSKGLDTSSLEDKYIELDNTEEEEAKTEDVQPDTPEEVPDTTPEEVKAETPIEADVDQEEVKDTPEETPETPEVVTLSLEDHLDSIKGMVDVSQSDSEAIRSAINTLEGILAGADEEGKDEEEEDEDYKEDAAKFIQVKTPAITMSIPTESPSKAKAINKAIRALLAEKRN